MKVSKGPLQGILIIEPDVYRDVRGSFAEVWRAQKYAELGVDESFVQDNVSLSKKGVLRGLHFQNPSAQGKLISVLDGEVFDVAVDLRIGSPTFGKWHGEILSSSNGRQFFVPMGFAHGFVVTSESALFLYKCTEYFNKETEKTILWNDPDLAIKWPIADPLVSEKDRQGRRLKELRPDELFKF
jgi:dTDP-4-dehydrorhamnose 3,5-epimerase